MTSENMNPILGVRLGAELKKQWEDYCTSLGKAPSTAIKEAIKQQLENAEKAPQPKTFKQKHGASEDEPKVRFEILMTASEKAAVLERANLEKCSQRRWIIDAIRTGLTREPQFNMKEIDILGESNYQLLAIGRNLNQIAKRLNAEERESVTHLEIKRFRAKIDKHVDIVSNAIRASLERWELL